MHSQSVITSIICCLIFGTSALPTDPSFTRRSQVLGMGDIGGINRDESTNFSSDTYGDALGQGIGNQFSPQALVGGIGGTSLLRRSQVNSMGNIGHVVRDESFNLDTDTLGDALNNGIDNVVQPITFADGAGSTRLIRRSQVVENRGNVEINRDESFNYAGSTYGDSVNSGLGNQVSPLSIVNGIGGRPLIRRSQVVHNGGRTTINRDESTNFATETLGDSVNSGIGNAVSPSSFVGAIGSTGLIRRSQVINKTGNNVINRDESTNAAVETTGNSVNNGLDNQVTPFAAFGGFNGFRNNRLFGRSQGVHHGGVRSVNRDESFNFATDTLGDSVNSGISNLVAPSNFVNGVGATSLIRRSQVINKSGTDVINRDESTNVGASSWGDSVNNGVNNRVTPVSFTGTPFGRFFRRSQGISHGGVKSINRDESFNFSSETLGDSVNQGLANVVAPSEFVNGLGGNFLIRRSQVIENSGNTAINRDESSNFFGSTTGDSVNNGVGNQVSPLSFVNGIGGASLIR